MQSNDIAALADAMDAADPVAAKGARLALEGLTHKAAAPGKGADRAKVADALVAALAKRRSRVARGHILRLVGFVGDRRHERALAAHERDNETGEDARLARERIRRGP